MHKQRALCVLSTASGKTRIAHMLLDRAAPIPEFKAIFLVNKKELVTQTFNTLSTSLDCGVFDAKYKNKDNQIIIGSLQSCYKEKFDGVKLIIADESHEIGDEQDDGMYQTFFKNHPHAKVIGFTATPYRNNRLAVGPGYFFPEIDFTRTVNFMIDNGYIVRPVCKAMPKAFNTSMLVKQKDDFRLSDLVKLTSNRAKAKEQVQDAMSRLHGRKKVVWICTTIEHAEMVKDLIPEPSAIRHSKHPNDAGQKYMFEQTDCRHCVSVMMLSAGWDCLDQQTDILTEHGWKGMGQVKEGDNVYSVNKTSRNLEMKPVTRYVERDVLPGEKFVTIKSQYLDIRVTDNHRFAFSRIVGGKRTLLPGLELNSSLPDKPVFFFNGETTSFNKTKVIDLKNEMFWLIGMLWTDGYEPKLRHSKIIYQSKPKIVEKIKRMLSLLNIDHSVSIKKKETTRSNFKSNYDLYAFTINRTSIRKSFGDHAECFTKKPHSALMQMTSEQFTAFWEGILDGNGSFASKKGPPNNKKPLATLCNKTQVDFIMHIATRLGFSCMHGHRKTKNNVDVYSLRIKQRTTHQLNFKSNKPGARVVLSDPTKGEKVWCVSNDNETLVTRRSGRIVVLGNCPPVDAIVMMRPTRSIRLAIQTFGRALRPHHSKSDALVLDYGEVIQNCGPIDDPLIERSFMKRGEKLQVNIKVCAVCFSINKKDVSECVDCHTAFPRPQIDRLKNTTTHAHMGNILSGGAKKEWVEAVHEVKIESYKAHSGRRCVRVSYYTDNKFPRFEYFTNFSWSWDNLVSRFQELGVNHPASFEQTLLAPLVCTKVPTCISLLVDGEFTKVKSVSFSSTTNANTGKPD